MTDAKADDLKVGDVMIYSGHGWSNTRSLVKIARLTATQIVIGEGPTARRFRRRASGHGVFLHYDELGHGLYGRGSLRPGDAASIAEVKDEQRRRDLLRQIDDVKWKDLSTAELEAVVDALPAARSPLRSQRP